MKYVEYGNQNPETIILLHGGGLSWWNYRDAAQYLSEQYHVVLPILDGHADSDAPFTSIDDNATRIIAYIDQHFGGKVLAVGGLSLGGQIAMEMLAQRPDICRFALLESTLVKPSKLTYALINVFFFHVKDLLIIVVVCSANHFHYNGELFSCLLYSSLEAIFLPPAKQGVDFDESM